ncbi:MAG TPA: hypothetical protein VF062_05555 [Candidatus Limnocylindrales bacterium]
MIAMLIAKFQDGSERRWRFELAPDVPLGREQLRTALVHEFLGEDAKPERFQLAVDGTLAQPLFILEEKKRSYFGKTEELSA